jgi:hypothetical protein
MRTRLLFLPLYVGLVFGIWHAKSATVTVGKVTMPQLSPMQWAYIQAEEGANLRRLAIDVESSITNGRVFNVRVRRGTNYPVIDKAIVQWIEATGRPIRGIRGEPLCGFAERGPALRQIAFSEDGMSPGPCGGSNTRLVSRLQR